MSILSDTDWLPPAIGLGVGMGEGILAVSGAEKQSRLIAPLYRAAVFGFGLWRELTAHGANSPLAIDINYSLMSAALALEGNLIPGAISQGTFTALGMTASGPAHSHAPSCSTCASRRPIVAAPLLTPAGSLRGYH